jgi:hypothetical protein
MSKFLFIDLEFSLQSKTCKVQALHISNILHRPVLTADLYQRFIFPEIPLVHQTLSSNVGTP